MGCGLLQKFNFFNLYVILMYCKYFFKINNCVIQIGISGILLILFKSKMF